MIPLRRRALREILGHDTRFALLDLVRRAPGVPVRAAADALGVDYSTVQYHARVLEKHGVLVTAPVAHALRLYPPNAVPGPRERRVLDARHCPTARLIEAAVRARGRATLGDLAGALGLPRTTAQAHLQRLARAGVLDHWREGGARVYAPAPGAPPLPDASGPPGAAAAPGAPGFGAAAAAAGAPAAGDAEAGRRHQHA